MLTIKGTSYIRRCRECWHSAEYKLPVLKKAIIYLDQFVISEVMKLRTPDAKGHKTVASEAFWNELVELLDRLWRLQLICCPNSGEQENESLLSPFFKALKSTYESYSAGISFNRADRIQRKQIATLAQAWAKGEEPRFIFDPKEIVDGDVHGWTDKMFIVIDSNKSQWVDDIRRVRASLYSGVTDIFTRVWKTERRTFDYWYELERADYQNHLLKKYTADRTERSQMALGVRPFSLEDMLPSPAEITIQMLEHIFSRNSESNAQETFRSFLEENRIKEAPFNKIASAMYASIAIKAAGGQKQPPNQGMVTDISLVSTLLPYCDAMFMDNGCRAILEDIPQSHREFDSSKVYSMNRKEDFITYLKGIEASATSKHLTVVAEIYPYS